MDKVELSSTLSILLRVAQQACEMFHPSMLEFLALALFTRHAKTLFPKMIAHTGQRVGKADAGLGIPGRAARSQRARDMLLQEVGHQGDHRKQTQEHRRGALDG